MAPSKKHVADGVPKQDASAISKNDFKDLAKRVDILSMESQVLQGLTLRLDDLDHRRDEQGGSIAENKAQIDAQATAMGKLEQELSSLQYPTGLTQIGSEKEGSIQAYIDPMPVVMAPMKHWNQIKNGGHTLTVVTKEIAGRVDEGDTIGPKLTSLQGEIQTSNTRDTIAEMKRRESDWEEDRALQETEVTRKELKEENQTLKDENQILQEEINWINSEYDVEIAELGRSAAGQVEELEKQIAEAKNEAQKLKMAEAQAVNDKIEVGQRHTALKERFKELRTAKHALTERVGELEAQEQAFRAEVHDLRRKYNNAMDAAEQYWAEKQRLEERLENRDYQIDCLTDCLAEYEDYA